MDSNAGYSCHDYHRLSVLVLASCGTLHSSQLAPLTPFDAAFRRSQVRNAQKAKIPLTCVVGKQEVENNSLSVRLYGGAELGAMPKDDVLARLLKASATRSNF